jgi:hypothetical protein
MKPLPVEGFGLFEIRNWKLLHWLGEPVTDDAMKQFRISDFERRIERNSLEEK